VSFSARTKKNFDSNAWHNQFYSLAIPPKALSVSSLGLSFQSQCDKELIVKCVCVFFMILLFLEVVVLRKIGNKITKNLPHSKIKSHLFFTQKITPTNYLSYGI